MTRSFVFSRVDRWTLETCVQMWRCWFVRAVLLQWRRWSRLPPRLSLVRPRDLPGRHREANQEGEGSSRETCNPDLDWCRSWRPLVWRGGRGRTDPEGYVSASCEWLDATAQVTSEEMVTEYGSLSV